MVFFDECDDAQQCFYHRLYTWPVAQTLIDNAYYSYDGVKGINPSIGNAFNTTENILSSIVNAPIISTAFVSSSRLGAHCLALAEEKFPALNTTTPDDIKGSINKNVQSAYDYAIKPSVDVVSQVYDGAKNQFTAFFAVLVAAVEYSESIVEANIANDLPDRINTEDPLYWRAIQIPYRVIRGLIAKVNLHGAAYYANFVAFLNNFNSYMQSTKQYAIEKKDQAVESAAYVAYLPADLSLRCVKASTYYSSLLSANVHGYLSSMRFVPQIALTPLDYANAYVQEVNTKTEKTNTLTDLAKGLYGEVAYRLNQTKMLAQSTVENFKSKTKSD